MNPRYSKNYPNFNHLAAPKTNIAKPKVIRFKTIVLLIISTLLIYSLTTLINRNKVAADSPFNVLYSGQPGYCLDDYHGVVKSNQQLDIWYCNGTKSQDFIKSAGQIKLYSTNYCLSELNNKAVLELCSLSNPSELWHSYDVGLANNKTNNCLSLSSSKLKDHNLVITASCGNMTSIKKLWTYSSWNGVNILAQSDQNCQSQSSVGSRIACYANQQWLSWESEPSLRPTLLNEYTDGNSYEEWCADFVSYIYKEAGVPFNSGERGTNYWDEYNANYIINTGLTYHSASSGYIPRAGDVAYFNYSGGHVEIVVKGGPNPTFIYGDSGIIDPVTHNGNMAENQITNNPGLGQVVYYLSPN